MKFFITAFCVLFASITFAQNASVIKINTIVIDKDSIAIPFTSYYDLAEDGCTKIVRYGHYNGDKHVFYGYFTDVAKDNPSLILAQGSYDAKGFKNDKFIMRFPNGNLCAKGSYKQNKYDGEWTFNYDNGKQWIVGGFEDGAYKGSSTIFAKDGSTLLVFEAKGTHCRIIDAWDKDGKKMISNGNGYYVGNGVSEYPWEGKLVNGKPDSTWTCSQNIGDSQVSIIENFENGVFQNGHVDYGNFQQTYADASRMNLLPRTPLLMIDRSDKTWFSGKTCSGENYPECYYSFMGKTFHVINMAVQEQKN